MNSEKEAEQLLMIMIALVFGTIGIIIGNSWKRDTIRAEIENEQRIEQRKGACVEYRTDFNPHYFGNGVDGSEYCVRWEDTENPGQYITLN